jgi:hypothetical protein
MTVTRVKGEVRGHDHKHRNRDRHDKKSWSRKSSDDC